MKKIIGIWISVLTVLILMTTPVLAKDAKNNLDVDGNGIVNGHDLIAAQENHDIDVFNAIIKDLNVGSTINELTLSKEMVDVLANMVKLQIELVKLSNPEDTQMIDSLTAQLRALEIKSEIIADILVNLNKLSR